MNKQITSFSTIVASILLGGCMSMSGQGTLDAVQEALSGKGEPQVFTEAYVEFAGPGSRWAGPQAFLLHVSAKDPNAPAEVSVSPAMFDTATGAPSVKTEGRKPASMSAEEKLEKQLSENEHGTATEAAREEAASDGKAVEHGEAKKSEAVASNKDAGTGEVSAAQAREQLSYLATAVQNDEKPFAGCLYPVRVRLVRADGALIDRQGCRGQTPWARVASQAVDYFMMKTR